MIGNFRDRRLRDFYAGKRVAAFQPFAAQLRRKLVMLEAAESLDDLRHLPGNRLEALKGRRAGQNSIRINDQWRLCFVWRDDAAWQVEVTDYH